MNQAATLQKLQKYLNLDSEHSRIVVVGLGKTGFSVVRFLLVYDFNFIVVDSRTQPPFLQDMRRKHPEIRVETGGFKQSDFAGATHLLVSPGVSLEEPLIRQAISKGAAILSDIDLFACNVDEPVIAITGSNGKSTVTALLGDMATAAGKIAAVGGNLGTPALDLVKQQTELYVLELSSFQLERTTALNAVAATVLNISPDHMDRHTDIDDYAKQKQRVFRGTGIMVLNADDKRVMAMQDSTRQTLTFSIHENADYHLQQIGDVEYLMHDDRKLLPVTDLALVGRHNVANAMAAWALGACVDLPEPAMSATLKTFQGLAHRMQRVAEIKGVLWINDSKATNLGACVAALQGCQGKVILIAGGDAKGADMSELAEVIRVHVKAAVLMGKDAGKIERSLKDTVPVHRADTMEQAVKIAATLAKPGEIVLLSPACASLDQYKNYQERGERFSTAVRSLAA